MPVFILTSSSSALLGRPCCGLSIWLLLLAIFNTLFWVYANLFHGKTDKTWKYWKFASFVWYKNGCRRFLGVQSINSDCRIPAYYYKKITVSYNNNNNKIIITFIYCTLARKENNNKIIGDFRVAFHFRFKERPSAKPFIWKLVLFTCKWTKIYVWIKLISIWKALH